MNKANHVADSSLFLPPDSYIYRILPCDGQIAAISSDDSLRIVDARTLQEVSNGIFEKVHDGVTCLDTYPRDHSRLATAGRDGTVKVWDLRTKTSALEYRDGM